MLIRYMRESERRTRYQKILSDAQREVNEANAALNTLAATFSLFGFGGGGREWLDKLKEALGSGWDEAARIARGEEEEDDIEDGDNLEEAEAAIPPETSRKVRDLVIDRLRVAGDAGTRASAIRKFIESTLGVTIHPKTAGMTLWRLSKEEPPLARREGQTWFFVPAKAGTENPGVSPPGSINSEQP